MLCLSGFELYSRWVPLVSLSYINLDLCLCTNLISFQTLLVEKEKKMLNCAQYLKKDEGLFESRDKTKKMYL